MSDGMDRESSGLFGFNTIIGMLAIVVGVAVFVVTPYEVERPRLLFGQTPSGLDPDFFPRMVAVFFIVVGGWLIWRARRLAEHNGLRDLTGENILNVVCTVAAMFVFALVFRPLGFVISSALLLGVLSTFYGNRNVVAGLLVCIGLPLLMFNVFRIGLQVVLPGNPFIDVLWF